MSSYRLSFLQQYDKIKCLRDRQTSKTGRQAACFVSSLRTWFEHFFRERLPVEGVVGRGEEMPIDVFSIHHLPGRGQQDGVLHQLAHHRIFRKDGGKVKKRKTTTWLFVSKVLQEMCRHFSSCGDLECQVKSLFFSRSNPIVGGSEKINIFQRNDLFVEGKRISRSWNVRTRKFLTICR